MFTARRFRGLSYNKTLYHTGYPVPFSLGVYSSHSNSNSASSHPEVVPSLYIGAVFEDDKKKPFGTNSKFRVSYRLRFCDREKVKFSRVGGTFDWVCYITDDF